MTSIVTLPRLLIEVAGTPLAVEDARALTEVRVHQRLSLPTVCELTFQEPGGPLATEAGDYPGRSLRIRVEGAADPLFVGEVTAVSFEYGPSRRQRIRIRGYDLLHRLRKRQPVGVRVPSDLQDLVETLTADLNIRVAAKDRGRVRTTLIQHSQSDLDLMTGAAQRCGLYFTLREEVLHLITLAGFGPPVDLEMGETLLESRIEVNTETACTAVETTGWDPHQAAPVSGRADRARVGRRVGLRPVQDGVGGTGRRTIADALVQDDRQAEGLAQAELDRRVAREVLLWGVAEGDPRLRPGAIVAIGGVAPLLAGRYVLTAVHHRIDHDRGYVSEIDTTPPHPTPRPVSPSATMGVVSRVNDPEDRGRVRVVLPGYGGVETSWLQVVVPGAGVGKGIVALPDVEDRVLVHLLNEDPDQAVVMGGLYGADSPPDAGVDEGAVRRYTLRTPGGQWIRLDDGEERIRIENSDGGFISLAPDDLSMGDKAGSRIALTPSGCRIEAATDLAIRAPGKSITISGRSIDFERR